MRMTAYPSQNRLRLRLVRCWMIVALLTLPASACDRVSRYLAGMDDPMYFTWEQRGEIATYNIPAPAATTTTRDTRQRIPGLLSEDALALPPQEAPIAPPAPSKGLAQDLKDCKAPTLQAPTAASVPGTPTIERAESSHVVAECMAKKGYRKTYSPLGATFP